MASLKDELRAKFVGQTLQNVPTPFVVLDLAKLEVNCQRMLDATDRLGLLWRAHIKTHKVRPCYYILADYAPVQDSRLINHRLPSSPVSKLAIKGPNQPP